MTRYRWGHSANPARQHFLRSQMLRRLYGAWCQAMAAKKPVGEVAVLPGKKILADRKTFEKDRKSYEN